MIFWALCYLVVVMDQQRRKWGTFFFLAYVACVGTSTAHGIAGGELVAPPSWDKSCTLYLVRHGESIPNREGKIVSSIEAGMDPANGLTEKGLEQARSTGKELKSIMLKAGCLPANTMVKYRLPLEHK
ncbi:unnamed protein product [Choristocarpus tenellus]